MGHNIDEINQCDEARFVELLGTIFEHSPWVPELVFPERPFDSRTSLHLAMTIAVRSVSDEMRMELLCSHPELAGKEANAGTLTAESRHEQADAGLNQCSTDELATLKSLNQDYYARFGFPFIVAVTGLDKHQIIAAMKQRMSNPKVLEINTAIDEVEKIARIRIDALIDE